jgi:hypothetical protein
LPARFKCVVKIGGKRARRARKVTERKMSNKHSLECRQAIYVKAGRVRKVTERKMGSKHLLEACQAILKYHENGRKRARRRGK